MNCNVCLRPWNPNHFCEPDCTACKDRGFWFQDWGPGGVRTKICQICDAGDEMREFLE